MNEIVGLALVLLGGVMSHQTAYTEWSLSGFLAGAIVAGVGLAFIAGD